MLGAHGLNGPVGLAWAGPAAVYVTETLAGRVARVNLDDGSKIIISTGLAEPEGLTVLTDGRIAVVEVGAQRLIAIDPAIDPARGAVEVLARGLPVGNPVARAPAPVYVPSGVAQGADGSLYLTGDRDNSILKLVANPR